MAFFTVQWLHENALLATVAASHASAAPERAGAAPSRIVATPEPAGAKVLELFHFLTRHPLPGHPALVPGACTLLVQWTTLVKDPVAVTSLLQLWTGDAEKISTSSSRMHEIPLTYGQGKPNDLTSIALAIGLTVNDVIRLHSEAEYTVAFLGFQPGFPYLTGLPKILQLPRLTTPRLRVPAGSVAIADIYSGIYPKATPGGWHILGVSSVTLFDPTQSSPSLLNSGDRVRFIPQ